MLKKWIATIQARMGQRDIRRVLYNIIDIGGLVGGVFSLCVSIFTGLPMVQNVAVFAADVILVIGYYIANKRGNINAAAFLVVFGISLILFPVMFYTGGGLYGGMGYWFLLGIIFNFLLIDGLLFCVLLAMQVIATLLCFVHSYYYPGSVIALEKGAMYVDVVQSLLVAAAIIGIIVKFQNRVYKDKLKELSEMNEENERLAKVAADANRAKSDFLAQMSHEIRTPINAVLGMNEMILRQSEDEDVLEYAGNIDSAGNTLLSLINTILDFSKIEDGKMEIVPVKYDTTSFISDLCEELAKHDNVQGLYYWFPEENGNGGSSWSASKVVITKWLNRGLWDNSTHKLNAAAKKLKQFLTLKDAASVTDVKEESSYVSGIYSVTGCRLQSEPAHGVYIKNGKKVVR